MSTTIRDQQLNAASALVALKVLASTAKTEGDVIDALLAANRTVDYCQSVVDVCAERLASLRAEAVQS